MSKHGLSYDFKIRTQDEIKMFLFHCMLNEGLGGSFHPDTPFSHYVKADGTPTFGAKKAENLRGYLGACIMVCEIDNADIYELTAEVGRALGYAPAIEENGEKQPDTTLTDLLSRINETLNTHDGLWAHHPEDRVELRTPWGEMEEKATEFYWMLRECQNGVQKAIAERNPQP